MRFISLLELFLHLNRIHSNLGRNRRRERSAYKITRLKNNEASHSAYSYVTSCLESATCDPHHLRRNFLPISLPLCRRFSEKDRTVVARRGDELVG